MLAFVAEGRRNAGDGTSRRRSVMLHFPINQMSIFSWREGRLSSNVNKACRREGGRATT